MLWIRDILVRIRRSVPLSYGSRSGSGFGSGLLFSSVAFQMLTKNKVFSNFFAFNVLKVPYIYISFQRQKNHKEVTKQKYIFCWMMEGSGSVKIMTDPDPEGPKKYGSTVQIYVKKMHTHNRRCSTIPAPIHSKQYRRKVKNLLPNRIPSILDKRKIHVPAVFPSL